MDIALLVDSAIAFALFVVAVCLQAIPITPLYYYQETLAIDVPKREEFIPSWAFFLIVVIVGVFLSYSIWNKSAVPFPRFLSCILAFVGAVSIASAFCSIFHVVLGTPRPDSIAQCRTVNVSYAECSKVLSKSELARQFQSFPSLESTVSMAAAAMLTNFIDLLVPIQTSLIVIFKGIVIGASVFLDALLLATGCYRFADIIAGALIGFAVACIGADSVLGAAGPRSLEAANPVEKRHLIDAGAPGQAGGNYCGHD